MEQMEVDNEWFKDKLDEANMSMRDLAKRLDMNISSLSRTFAGHRRMQMEEAKQIAHFLRAPISEVMRHAGVAVDLDGLPTRVMLAATIGDDGYLERLRDPKPLPQAIIDKAQAAISKSGNGRIIAAQVRSTKGGLALFDDAMVLFAPSDAVDPSAIGALSIVRNRDTSAQAMVRLIRARKTGEALVQLASGATKEVTLDTASPVIAIIP